MPLKTMAEMNRLARTTEARIKGFGKTSETFAKGAKARVARFSNRKGR